MLSDCFAVALSATIDPEMAYRRVALVVRSLTQFVVRRLIIEKLLADQLGRRPRREMRRLLSRRRCQASQYKHLQQTGLEQQLGHRLVYWW